MTGDSRISRISDEGSSSESRALGDLRSQTAQAAASRLAELYAEYANVTYAQNKLVVDVLFGDVCVEILTLDEP